MAHLLGGGQRRFLQLPLHPVGKVFSDKVGLKTIELGLDILGGMGIMRDSPSEKIVRDLLTFLHGDGTDSATLLEVANTLDNPA